MEVVLDRVSGMEKIELLDELDRIVAIINDAEDGNSPSTANVGGDIDSMLRGTSQPDQQFDAKALQNRDRSRQSYVMQMQKIASNPDYDRASTSKTPDTGAPMVFVRNKQIPSSTSGKSEVVTMSDGKGGTVKIKAVYAVVEAEDLTASHDASGGKVDAYGGDTGIMALNNGRTAALKQAYKQDSAGEYRNALVSDKSHGISAEVIEKMHHPVLVRVFSESALIGIDDPGAASNTSAGAALSASEQAETDAKKLDDAALMQYQGGDVNSAGNRDFVRAFVRSMGGSDAVGDMQTADGMISADGVKRIEGALVAKAYGDNAILNDLTESPDSDLKSLGDVLKDVAGRWAVMKSGAKDGAINRDMDITPQLNEAIAMIRKARQQGKRISELVNQNDMFSGQTNPVTEALLRLMFRGDDMARIRSADKIKKAIHGFIDKAMSTTDGADMFGFKATPMDLIKQQQNDIQNEENAGKAQKGLFDSVANYFNDYADMLNNEYVAFDSIRDLILDSALSGMEKIELLDELDDIADKIDDPSVSGMDKIDLLDRFDEIVDLINGDGEESESVLPDANEVSANPRLIMDERLKGVPLWIFLAGQGSRVVGRVEHDGDKYAVTLKENNAQRTVEIHLKKNGDKRFRLDNGWNNERLAGDYFSNVLDNRLADGSKIIIDVEAEPIIEKFSSINAKNIDTEERANRELQQMLASSDFSEDGSADSFVTEIARKFGLTKSSGSNIYFSEKAYRFSDAFPGNEGKKSEHYISVRKSPISPPVYGGGFVPGVIVVFHNGYYGLLGGGRDYSASPSRSFIKKSEAEAYIKTLMDSEITPYLTSNGQQPEVTPANLPNATDLLEKHRAITASREKSEEHAELLRFDMSEENTRIMQELSANTERLTKEFDNLLSKSS